MASFNSSNITHKSIVQYLHATSTQHSLPGISYITVNMGSPSVEVVDVFKSTGSYHYFTGILHIFSKSKMT
jgi:hypothetical protein